MTDNRNTPGPTRPVRDQAVDEVAAALAAHRNTYEDGDLPTAYHGYAYAVLDTTVVAEAFATLEREPGRVESIVDLNVQVVTALAERDALRAAVDRVRALADNEHVKTLGQILRALDDEDAERTCARVRFIIGRRKAEVRRALDGATQDAPRPADEVTQNLHRLAAGARTPGMRRWARNTLDHTQDGAPS